MIGRNFGLSLPCLPGFLTKIVFGEIPNLPKATPLVEVELHSLSVLAASGLQVIA